MVAVQETLLMKGIVDGKVFSLVVGSFNATIENVNSKLL